MNEKDEMKKIYLAIPYSGMGVESSFKQANEAAAIILNKGFNVFSPISHCHVIAKDHKLPETWDFWKHVDYQFIDWSDEIWVLIPKEGIEPVRNSTGVNAEIKYAKETGKTVRFFKKGKGILQEFPGNPY
jgi:nucleoside 2-deoxyribosyltransferase